LVELPSRANSTVRRPSVPIPSPRQLAVSSQPPVVEVSASPKAIKKEKTRSRVWGLLGIRSKKSKDVLAKAAPPVGYVAPARAAVQQDQNTLTPSRGESCPLKSCVDTDDQCRNEFPRSTPSRLTIPPSILLEEVCLGLLHSMSLSLRSMLKLDNSPCRQ
jgi:hypothetical protein